MTNNPTDVLNGGGQMPLGGAEETSMTAFILILFFPYSFTV